MDETAASLIGERTSTAISGRMKALLRPITACLVAIATCLFTPATAKDAAAVVAHAPQTLEQTAQVHPALWKVADEDTTIYLFGTIHVLPQGIDWFHGPIAEAFAGSGLLVTEIAKSDPAVMQGLVTKLATLPKGKTLRDGLSPNNRAEYEQALAKFGVPPVLFDRFKPWYGAVALSTLPLIQQGFTVEHGIEEQLEKRANARSLPHIGLETPEYQLGLFDSLPVDAQERYLIEVVGQLPTIKTQIDAMVDAWKHGNAGELARIMNADESDPMLTKVLLTDRNRKWARWIDKRMNQPGTVFLAVGAGHLAGSGSLQEQLAVLGIASTRLQ